MKPNYGLPEAAVQDIGKALFKLLANNNLLYLKTRNCHWNLEDPNFISLHKLFEEQYEQLAESGDLIAEKLRQMGVFVKATMKEFLEKGTIEEIDAPKSGKEMLEALAQGHESTMASFREVIHLAAKHGDEGTVDLLSGLLRDHEKTAWFLRSHL